MANATKRRSETTGVPALARSEWDFSRVPEAELQACFVWEYAREWENLNRAIEDASRKASREKRISEDDIGCTCGLPLLDVTRLLATPWQDLQAKERSRFLHDAMPESIGVSEMLEDGAIAYLRTALFVTPELRLEDLRPKGAGIRIAAFCINWEQSDKRLMGDFARWLKENRERPAREQRGRNRRDDLNMLGATRLLHHMKLEDAIILTTRTLGEPLYGKRPSWERARKSALRVFREDFLIDPQRWQEDQYPKSYPKFGGEPGHVAAVEK